MALYLAENHIWQQTLETNMLWLKWRRTLIVLLAANLLFLTLLEIQRQTIWDHEAQYFARIIQLVEANDQKNEARFKDMFGQVMEMNSHVYSVAVTTEKLSDNFRRMIKELEEKMKVQSTPGDGSVR
jgi:hypothetical protein